MIVRVLRATVRPGRVGAFNALFRRQVSLLHEQPGLVYVKLARRLHADGSQEAVLFEEWQDAPSLYGWVGPNLTEPRLIPGIRELVDDVSVAHYESLAEEAAATLDVAHAQDGADAEARGASGDPAAEVDPRTSGSPPPRSEAAG